MGGVEHPHRWDRLVRYISAVDGQTHYGEPILSKDAVDRINDLTMSGQLKVKALTGTNIFDLHDMGKVDTVQMLLGPLEPKDVPVIRCIGINYKTHIRETGLALPVNPVLFTKPSYAVAGHSEDIPIPSIAQAQCDYEGELTVVIGKTGKDILEDDAMGYVAGYTIGNDVSARNWQREPDLAGPRPQWTFSKSFDKFAPLGPCLVASHILGEANNLDLEVRVNGELRQKTNTEDLCFGVRKLIAFCSQGQTLEKGSLIMTGTPGGVGLFMKPPTFLKHGDIVDIRIQGIGKLSNRITMQN